MKQSVIDVLEERRRQVEDLGWSDDNDDEYVFGELSFAAARYADHACDIERYGDEANNDMDPEWPWNPLWWKPTTARRDLVKAAALILAEIDRLDRAG